MATEERAAVAPPQAVQDVAPFVLDPRARKQADLADALVPRADHLVRGRVVEGPDPLEREEVARPRVVEAVPLLIQVPQAVVGQKLRPETVPQRRVHAGFERLL